MTPRNTILIGDASERLRHLPDAPSTRSSPVRRTSTCATTTSPGSSAKRRTSMSGSTACGRSPASASGCWHRTAASGSTSATPTRRTSAFGAPREVAAAGSGAGGTGAGRRRLDAAQQDRLGQDQPAAESGTGPADDGARVHLPFVQARQLLLRSGCHPRAADLAAAATAGDGIADAGKELGRPSGSRDGLLAMSREGRSGHPLGKNPSRCLAAGIELVPRSALRHLPVRARPPSDPGGMSADGLHGLRPALAAIDGAGGLRRGRPPQRRPFVPCGCGAPTRPGLVLDPFGGSGHGGRGGPRPRARLATDRTQPGLCRPGPVRFGIHDAVGRIDQRGDHLPVAGEVLSILVAPGASQPS